MLAIDTNVLVRYLVGDGGDQFDRATRILEHEAVFVSLTVVLETEWVLRDAYEFERGDILEALQDVIGLPTVAVSDERALRTALAYAAAGLDFADALHVAQASDCEGFATFDKRLIRKAKGSIDAAVRAA
jgi:predicted nucleic-acid-binding protein